MSRDAASRCRTWWNGCAPTVSSPSGDGRRLRFPVALAAWTLTGVDLAYPRPHSAIPATELATAAITAEGFGGLFGRAVGGAVVAIAVGAALAMPAALTITYLVFAAMLAGATLVAKRS